MLKNLTPHTIHILGCTPPSGVQPATLEIPSSGVARASEVSTPIGSLLGVPVTRSTFGAPEGLPEPVPGVWLIVSTITAEAARAAGRELWDLMVPGTPVRDEAGRIIGVTSLRAVDADAWTANVQAIGIVGAIFGR